MNKKGFTLVELMAVIIILGVIMLIVLPVVDKTIKTAKDAAYNAQIDRIKKAASDWAISNAKYLPDDDGESIMIYLGELKSKGFIDIDIKNPKNSKILSNNTTITITKNNASYEFVVNIVELDNNDDANAPILAIEGNIIDYVEVNQNVDTYTIPTATAKTTTGDVISSSYISYQIIKGNSVVGSVDTSRIGSYKIIYTVTYNGQSGTYEKLVEVRDTTAPIINISSSISTAVGSSIDYTSGVTVTDNSAEVITPTIDSSKVGNTAGTYYVYYTAIDSSGNEAIKQREVILHN